MQSTTPVVVLRPNTAICLDHLPLPHDADLSRIPRVPLRCSTVFRGVDFLQYPLHLSPPRAELLPEKMDDIQQRRIAILAITVADLEKIFQEWLFFGLVHEILDDFGQELSVQVFSRRVMSEGKYLCTAKLYDAGRAWIDVVRAQLPSMPDKEQRYETYLKCFHHVSNCLNGIKECSPGQNGILSDRPSFNKLILFSIGSVAEALAHMVHQAFKDDRCTRIAFSTRWIDADIFRQMQSHGWCVNEIERAKNWFIQPSVQFFLSEMRKPHGIGKHEGCVELFCQRSQINVERYKPVHRVEQCDCAMVEVEAEDIRLTLQQDAFPVLRAQADESKHLDVIAVKALSKGNTPYLAISHVWAHGLGNPCSNAIFKCQWQYLVNILQRLKPKMIEAEIMDENAEPCVFLDTLSIPTSSDMADPEAESRKFKAIGQLRHIYQKAVAVLVLDESLTACKYSILGEFGDFEALMRLYTSAWMGRLWTYQEDLLAKRLWIQFSDRVVPIAELTDSVWEKHAAFSAYSLVAYQVLGVRTDLNSFRSMQELQTMRVHPISLVWKGIWGRNVSISEDEPICLATLLDVDTRIVASQPPVSRMQCLWECVDRSTWGIPLEVIVHQGPRVAAHGYHWAPLSMLRASGSKSHMEIEYSADRPRRGALIRGLGLRVCLPGFRIEVPPARFKAPEGFGIGHDSIPVRSEYGWYLATIAYRLVNASTSATVAEVMQSGNTYAMVIATSEFVPFTRERADHRTGAYGPFQRTKCGETDLLSLKTEFILDLWHLPSQRQMFLEAAYRVAKALPDDPAVGQPPLPVDGIIDLRNPENMDYGQRIWSVAKAFVQSRVTPECELAAAAKVMYPGFDAKEVDGLRGPQLGFMFMAFQMFYDRYAIVTEEFSEQQDWIVD